MPRLIWVFAGRTLILLVLSCRGSSPHKKATKPSLAWLFRLGIGLGECNGCFLTVNPYVPSVSKLGPIDKQCNPDQTLRQTAASAQGLHCFCSKYIENENHYLQTVLAVCIVEHHISTGLDPPDFPHLMISNGGHLDGGTCPEMTTVDFYLQFASSRRGIYNIKAAPRLDHI